MKMDNRLKLGIEDILERDFQVSFKGYDAQEVDHFLDLITKDYEYFNTVMSSYQKEISSFKKQLKELTEEYEKLRNNYEVAIQQRDRLEEKGLRNVDIINRLSKLESKFNK